MALTEDAIYRTSTQYRLWSYTPESLASLRQTTNKLAVDRVLAAIARANGQTTIETLSPAEELKILTHYTRQLITWSTTLFHFPSAVTATAATYFRRFYLSNSPMTYHPKDIFPTAIFLATKTENHQISLSSFVAKIRDSPAKPKPSAEQILAPEYLLTQGLRFTFDVRHPLRGLEGGWIELTALARAEPLISSSKRKPEALQQDLFALSLPPPWTDKAGKEHRLGKVSTAADAEDRIGQAHNHAKAILSEAALLTDVYFLFTPAQIWLAAILLADEALAKFYMDAKFGDLGRHARSSRVLSTIRACADTMASYNAGTAPSSASKQELVPIDKKLYQCQNPDKRDLVGLNEAKKRGGGMSEPDSAAKKRKVAENGTDTNDDDVFGRAVPEAANGLKK